MRSPPAEVQPRPGGAALAPGRAYTSPPSMKLSRPHSGTSMPPSQWKGVSGAGAQGARPYAASQAGPLHPRGGRVSSHEVGAQGEARPLQPRGLYAFARPCTACSTAARSRRPAARLSFYRQKAHILASSPRGVPPSLPKPREPFNAQRKVHRRSTSS